MRGRAPAVGIVLAVILAFLGAQLGSRLATPVASPRLNTVTADVVLPVQAGWHSLRAPLRDLVVGVTGEQMRSNAMALLATANIADDPPAAAAAARATFGLTSENDACTTDPVACPTGSPGVVLAGTDPELPATGGPTWIYAVTDDLIAVTVEHEPGAVVSVYPNVLNSDEPTCDPVVAGYDLLARPLGSVEAGDRTTFGFDINEGLTIYLCVEAVGPSGTYHAQALVQTADRLLPQLSIVGVRGELLPGWTVRGVLPSGQRCGAWPIPSLALYSEVEQDYQRAHVLCEATDVLSTAIPPGRGVLPLSAGDHATFTVEQTWAQLAPVRSSLGLGPAALCTGVCAIPDDSTYVVTARGGTVTIRLSWVQGNSNGATSTRVLAESDSRSTTVVGAQLDVPSASIRQVGFAVDTRSGTAQLAFRVDRSASYVARLVPVDGCSRPAAELERVGSVTGSLHGEGPPTGTERPVFTGLCAGSDYRVVIELTDVDGVTTSWENWGAAALLHTREVTVPVTIEWRLNSDSYLPEIAGQSAFLTLRAADSALVGPHAGGCFGTASTLTGEQVLPVLRLGENVRISGSVQTAGGTLDNGECTVDWSPSQLALTFAAEFTLDELLSSPEGLVFRVDQPLDADPSIRASASAIVIVRAG